MPRTAEMSRLLNSRSERNIFFAKLIFSISPSSLVLGAHAKEGRFFASPHYAQARHCNFHLSSHLPVSTTTSNTMLGHGQRRDHRRRRAGRAKGHRRAHPAPPLRPSAAAPGLPRRRDVRRREPHRRGQREHSVRAIEDGTQ